MSTAIKDKDLLLMMRAGSKEAFTILFVRYYKNLVQFAGIILHDKDKCEDIVQNIFFKLWHDKDELSIIQSLKSYLLRAVQNACFDELRHMKQVRKYEVFSNLNFSMKNIDTENYILYHDLKSQLNTAITLLPKNLQEIFRMSRLEGIKYKDIAEKLAISERTVEVRMSKAIRQLRELLKEYFE